MCIECDCETGNAGNGEGSLYFREEGPYCEDCYNSICVEMVPIIEEEAAALEARVKELEGENARLREALEKMLKIKHNMYGGDWDEIEKAQEIALKALEGGE